VNKRLTNILIFILKTTGELAAWRIFILNIGFAAGAGYYNLIFRTGQPTGNPPLKQPPLKQPATKS
jgi:hypothetical protein